MLKTIPTPTGETPELILNTRRNLVLIGNELVTEITIDTRDDARLEVKQHAGKVIVDCDKDVQITVPDQSLIRLQTARGNAELKKLRGDVDIDRVRGNLRLEDVNTSHINRVDGNLDAKNLGIAFSCEGVGGNATVKGAACPIELRAGGNLELQDVTGIVRGNAGGDARLKIHLPHDSPIKVTLNAGGQARLDVKGGDDDIRMTVTAGGNIDCNLDEGLNARVNIASGAGFKNLKFGEGDGLIELSCGGNANLKGVGEADHTHTWEPGGSERTAKTIRLGEKRTVVFEVGIDLKLEGYEGDEVIVERGGSEVHDVDGEIHIEAGMGCRARVPNNTVVRANVGVDCQVRNFEGELNIDAGASARVKGFVGIANIQAGAEAKIDFEPTGDSKIEAGADVRCWIPVDANVTVNLSDMKGERTETFGDGTIKLDLGAGVSAKVMDIDNLGGSGVNINYDKDYGFKTNISPEIEKQILEFTAEMTTAAARLSEGVSTIPMPDWLKGEVGDMHRRVEEATRRAQERIARRIESATRRAQRKAEKAGKSGVQMRGDFDIDLPFFKVRINNDSPEPPTPPRPPDAPRPPEPPTPPSPFASSRPTSERTSEPVSNEERMTILRMLEQKKITAEQAAQLLAAMGE
jgi:hypothetical protein